MAATVATVARAAAKSNRTPISWVKSLIQTQSAPRAPKPAAATPKSPARRIGWRVNAPAAQAIARMATKPATTTEIRPR